MKSRQARDGTKPTTSVVDDYLQVLHYLTRDGCTLLTSLPRELPPGA